MINDPNIINDSGIHPDWDETKAGMPTDAEGIE